MTPAVPGRPASIPPRLPMPFSARPLRTATTTALACLALLLTSCGTGEGAGHYMPDPAVVVDAVDCLTYEPGGAGTGTAEDGGAGSVPEGFTPVAAVLCSGPETTENHEGRWTAVSEQHLAGDLGPLLAALAEPSDSARPDQACTADMEIVPALWLTDAAGRAIQAQWPTTSCGKTKPGAREALRELDIVSSELHPVSLVETRTALDAGCSTQWSMPVPVRPISLATEALEAPDGGYRVPADTPQTLQAIPVSPGLVPDPESVRDTDTMRSCLYDPEAQPPEAQLPEAQLRDAPLPDGTYAEVHVAGAHTGTFTGARTLAAATARMILTAAGGGPQAGGEAPPSCVADGASADESARFAVLWFHAASNSGTANRSDGAPLVAVAGECPRLVLPDGSARALTPEMAAAVGLA